MSRYSASCRHCQQIVITEAPYLRELDFEAMRAHLKVACLKLSLDLTAASVGELLKQYDVARG